jgi:hypothetical protein
MYLVEYCMVSGNIYVPDGLQGLQSASRILLYYFELIECIVLSQLTLEGCFLKRLGAKLAPT